MLIAVVALIVFGPRKLPEIGRTLGKSLAEFKRASDDFKRTWEYEVELDSKKPSLPAVQETNVGGDMFGDGGAPVMTAKTDAETLAGEGARSGDELYTVARNSSGAAAKSVEAHESPDEPGDDEINAS